MNIIQCHTLKCKNDTIEAFKFCPDCMRKAGISDKVTGGATALLGVAKLLNPKAKKDPAALAEAALSISHIINDEAFAQFNEAALPLVEMTIIRESEGVQNE